MPKFFRFPWASTGDKTTIPDETDVAGFVSYQQGYGYDYARDPASDPLAKLIERDKMNQLYSDLTENAQYWQTHAFPEYITAAQNGGVAYAYDIDAIVRYDDGGGYKVFQNTVAGNTNLPTGAGWVEYKIEAIINAAAEKTTPVDADLIGLVDSAASNALKKLTWANIKTALTGLFAPINSPAFTGTPTAPTPTAGDNSTKIATTAFVQSAVTAGSGVGVGQTYQDVKASRVANTTYTNSTGKPIFVSVTLQSSVAYALIKAVVGGVTFYGSDTPAANSGTMKASIAFIVPNNATYLVVNSLGTSTVIAWAELR